MERTWREQPLLYVESPFIPGAYRGRRPLLRPAPLAEREAYLKRLEKELSARTPPRPFAAVRVGGTASMLPTDGLARLLRGVRRRCCEADCELTLTVSPPTVTSPCLSALAVSGYTRIELDVLSLSGRILEQAGAPFDTETVEDALEMLLDYGCPNVSVRLLYGVQGQTEGQLRDAMFVCASLPGVRHVRLSALDADDTAQYRFCAGYLAREGFEAYAPGRFARRGGEDGYFLRCTAGAPVTGVGTAAVSR